MPNWVTNIIVAEPHVLDTLRSEDRDVDFDTLIPIPDDDDPIFTAERSEVGNYVCWGFDGYSPLDWAREYWGTKWNACHPERKYPNQVNFQTPWSYPQGILEALFARFPDEDIAWIYADEDSFGGNHGYIIRVNGRTTKSHGIANPDFAQLIDLGHIPYTLQYDDEFEELLDF